MIPFLALVRKDLKLFFSDRKAVLIGLVVPIVCGSFFGYLFGGQGGNTETSKIPVLVIDQDNSDTSRELVAQLSAEKALEVKPSSIEEARVAVRKGKATAAIIIPNNFGKDAGHALFTSETKPQIGVLYDPSHGAEREMVKGILSGAVMQAVSKETFTTKTGLDMLDESLAQVEKSTSIAPTEKKTLTDMLTSVKRWNEQQQGQSSTGQTVVNAGFKLPFDTREEAITSGEGIEYNGYAHSFGGMGIQFILFMGLDVGVALLMLRQSGLWQRLRAAPLSRTMLLGSRAVSAALISGFILTVLFLFARIVFRVHIRGSVAGFIAVCAAFSLMTAAFGLMVAALGETVEATRGYAVMATLLMVMLGGAWVPTFVFPKWLQKITVVVPTRWAMDGWDGMTWRGLGFDSIILPVAILLAFTLAFGMVAVMRFRWRTEG
jgi:ABC-2 type transport system permease protein